MQIGFGREIERAQVVGLANRSNHVQPTFRCHIIIIHNNNPYYSEEEEEEEKLPASGVPEFPDEKKNPSTTCAISRFISGVISVHFSGASRVSCD